ncbi:hypothetical protein GGR52DRAFT_34211 [Hypoxylon sp. FL1284]|nr:hypothetical protein GGR52DRAFT_34211 [Hypoxylon sp. FL1284]
MPIPYILHVVCHIMWLAVAEEDLVPFLSLAAPHRHCGPNFPSRFSCCKVYLGEALIYDELKVPVVQGSQHASRASAAVRYESARAGDGFTTLVLHVRGPVRPCDRPREEQAIPYSSHAVGTREHSSHCLPQSTGLELSPNNFCRVTT